MRALVTGGGGFLGGHIVRALLQRGDDVFSFSRSNHTWLEAAGVRQIAGDLTDRTAVAEAVAGVDVVFHVAGMIGAWGPYEEYRLVNVEGTRNVVEACVDATVKALVFTSSPSVVFDGRDFEGVDESLPYCSRYLAPYPRSKAAAERATLAADDPAGLRTVALRPHLVLGEHDGSLTPRVLDRGRAGRLRGISGPVKKVAITWVADAARAHLLAADELLDAARAGGKPYFIASGEPLAVGEVFDRILAAGGLPPVGGKLPRAVALVGATLVEWVWRLLRRTDEPPITRWAVHMMASAHWFDLSAARRDLGYVPEMTHDEGFEALAQWLAEAGHIRSA